MKCPKCGKDIANDSAFCEYCGEPIKENRKYAIRRTDIRWILLLAMIIASLFTDEQHADASFLPSLVLLIVSIVYAIRSLLQWSFVIVMTAFVFFNIEMCNSYRNDWWDYGAIVLIVYLIYAFIAYKKKWIF